MLYICIHILWAAQNGLVDDRQLDLDNHVFSIHQNAHDQVRISISDSVSRGSIEEEAHSALHRILSRDTGVIAPVPL